MENNRPKKTPKRSRQKKEIPLNIRCAASEKEAFERAAFLSGIPLSAWMRERLRAAAVRELDNVGELAAFLAKETDDDA